MRITNSKYDLVLDLNDSKIYTLVIENPIYYSDVISGLNNQILGEEGDFCLFEKEKEINFSKDVYMIIDPFNIDINEKRIINKLYNYLSLLANESIDKVNIANIEIMKVLDEIILMSGFNNITFVLDCDWAGICKLYDVKFDSIGETLLEKVVEYIKVISSLCKAKLIVFVGIKNYLSENEIEQLQKEIFGCKINVLFIENIDRTKAEYEEIIIIDSDRCLIKK